MKKTRSGTKLFRFSEVNPFPRLHFLVKHLKQHQNQTIYKSELFLLRFTCTFSKHFLAQTKKHTFTA
jgi:hypothetical protein